MKKLITEKGGPWGPYEVIEVLEDRYRVDGADLPFTVVGTGTIEEWTGPLPVHHDPEAYKWQREAAYPSFADQFDLLYHGGMDAWKAAIQAVKDQYPKG